MKYFKMSEFACKDGCGFVSMNEEFLAMIDKARELAGIPFVITSGCRCAKHNKAVGGVASSSHTTGHAADISASTGVQKYTIVKALMEAGFKRIGIAKSFIHVDNDPGKPSPSIFLYS